MTMSSPATAQDLTILHFNDVYHVSNTDLVARFATALTKPRSVAVNGSPLAQGGPTLRIFSGDAFSPSLEAAVLRGDHMVPVLDILGIDVACYGNHDFDFGEDRLVELVKQTRFPWTLANAVSTVGGRLLANAHEYVIKEAAGYRIGFFGLAGSDWPSNCKHLPHCTLLDPAAVARQVAAHLRRSEECDLVIAVTHMRLIDDLVVSNATLSGDERVDLVLGGHDHHVIRREPGDNNMDPETIQSGSYASGANMTNFIGNSTAGTHVVAFAHTGSIVKQISDLERLPEYNDITPLPQMLRILGTVHDEIEKVVRQPLFRTGIPLEGRMSLVRRQETNLGNLLADAIRAFIALINSGAIRCDRVINCNNGLPLCIRDLIEISPFDNTFVVKQLSGEVLSKALENSVSNAHTDGRFLKFSGLCITVNWRWPEGRRVCSIFHTPPQNGTPQPLDMDRMYTVAMVDFIGSGFDGYSCFQSAKTLINVEGAITDTNLLEIFKTSDADKGNSETAGDHTNGGQRARKTIIHRYHELDGLPIVMPILEDRIKFLDESNL
ncbi:hypothetical protein UA08_00561 [Talaromyces atroroseus]|uniref:5'-Nucleotidase C-terminal domain-containing protein n=1 Tax=Talaromyces atroroseus TaxID=1441469 RepID=A0A225B946_TALAT|nr:hypothetical protein UA08_00561 [Talaromyces atroroseus]OKL64609.1 hypothetical protein UA08_00561 [Talaromyces atroroseus]